MPGKIVKVRAGDVVVIGEQVEVDVLRVGATAVKVRIRAPEGQRIAWLRERRKPGGEEAAKR